MDDSVENNGDIGFGVSFYKMTINFFYFIQPPK